MQELVLQVSASGNHIKEYRTARYLPTTKSYMVSDDKEGTVSLTDLVLQEVHTLQELHIGLKAEKEEITPIEVSAAIVSKLCNLKSLSLRNCIITGGSIADCISTDLKVLVLNGCMGDTTGLIEKIVSLKSSLVVLELGNLQFSDKIDLDLSEFKELRSIKLYDVLLSEQSILPPPGVVKSTFYHSSSSY